MGNIECCAEDEETRSSRGSAPRSSVIRREDISKAQRYVKSLTQWAHTIVWFREVEDYLSKNISQLDKNFQEVLKAMVTLKEETIPDGEISHAKSVHVVQRFIEEEGFIQKFNLQDNKDLKEFFGTTAFFKVTEKPGYFDFTKLILFVALYDKSADKEDKIVFLFKMLADESSDANQAEEAKISYGSVLAEQIVVYLTRISCSLTAAIIKENYLEDEEDQSKIDAFEELFQVLCSAEQDDLFDHQFAKEMIRKKIFGGKKKAIGMQEFVTNMQKHNNMLIISEMIRNEYIYYVHLKKNPEVMNKSSLTSVFSEYDDRKSLGSQINGSVKDMISVDRHTVQPNDQSSENKLIMQNSEMERQGRKSVGSGRSGGKALAYDSQNNMTPDGPTPGMTPGQLPIKKGATLNNASQQMIDEMRQVQQQASAKSQSYHSEGEGIQFSDHGSSNFSQPKNDSDEQQDDEDQNKGDFEIDQTPLEEENNKMVERLTELQRDSQFTAQQQIELNQDALTVHSQQRRTNTHKYIEKSEGGRQKIKSDMHESMLDEEEEKFIDERPSDLQRKSTNALSESEAAGKDPKFSTFVVILDNEMKAEMGTLKKQKISGVDINFEKRLLFKRQKRFDENRKLLRKANEKNRKKLKLWGPATEKALNMYSNEVKEILKDLKEIEMDGLWNWCCGKPLKRDMVKDMMDAYLSILMEMGNTRRKAEKIQQITQDMSVKIENSKVWYLPVGYLTYWNKLCADPDKADELEQEVKYMQRFDKILMIYFPKMQEVPTPTPGQRTSDGNSSTPGATPGGLTVEQQQEKINSEYTPFLVEMNPRENSVELYYKALLDDSSDAAQENMQQKQMKISYMCIDIFEHIALSQNKSFDASKVEATPTEIPVVSWEEFVVVATHILEGHLYKREFKMNTIVMQQERDKLVDLFVQLLKFE